VHSLTLYNLPGLLATLAALSRIHHNAEALRMRYNRLDRFMISLRHKLLEMLTTGHLKTTTTSPKPSSEPKHSQTPSSSLNLEALIRNQTFKKKKKTIIKNIWKREKPFYKNKSFYKIFRIQSNLKKQNYDDL